MLEKVKLALRITTNAFDDELLDLIAAACDDLGVAGILQTVLSTPQEYPLVILAVISYCKLHFGEPTDFDHIKRSYDEQKSQLQTATGYTDWGDD